MAQVAENEEDRKRKFQEVEQEAEAEEELYRGRLYPLFVRGVGGRREETDESGQEGSGCGDEAEG